MSRVSKKPKTEPPLRIFLSIPETAAALSIGRSSIYKLIEAKRLDARKLRFKTLITVASVVALQETTPKMTHGTYDRFFKKPTPKPGARTTRREVA